MLNNHFNSKRSTFYSKWCSRLNFFFSYNGRWRLSSPNIDLIKKHVNEDLIDSDKLKISRECSRPIEDHPNNEIYQSCIKYNSGNCWWNGKLSNDDPLCDDDKKDVANLKTALDIVKPVPFPIDLFHGFEYHLKYDESKWAALDAIGSTHNFPFFLSKTLSWKVATFFSAMTSRYYQKYLLCRYTKPGSRHICMNIRTNFNDEYEYLSGYETFKFTEKIYQIGLLPWPTLRVYYALECC